ncbi:hypothetical protein L6452_19004 [Arctium lappa]|uniref:Uncharacterized protein n=1 Tax=Arctium lappa TaxID=4217 RepID=A0ACB9B8R6_ARCLA|nr:hypothetical protein L6452_19004 [Arctium lappa]
MASKIITDPMIQDEIVLQDDPSDRASHETPMSSVPSVGENLSAQRRTPNDVFPTMLYILPYNPNNYFVDFDKIKIHPVIRAILNGHPLAPALTYYADVPERLRLILELPEPNSRPGRTSYDSFPSESDVLEGIRNLGYLGDLDKVGQFDKSNLPPVCNSDIPRRLSWPQVPDTEMTFIQRQKKTFEHSMTIPYALINDFSLEAEQAEPSNDEQDESFQADQEVETDVAVQQIGDVLAEIDNETVDVVHDDVANVDDDIDGNGDGDTNADIGNAADGDDDDNDNNDGDQSSLHVYERSFREPEVHTQEDVMSEEESVPINVAVVEVQDTTAKFTSVNEIIEIDPVVLPEVIPFRRPTGVVIREPSTKVSTTAPAIVYIPPPPSFTQSAGISASTFMPQVSTSVPPVTSSILVQDLPISELTDMLYARLLSMSPPDQQHKDLISLLRNFQSTPTPASTSAPDRVSALTEAGLFHKRTHDQDDPDHQGHEGEMSKRQRVEISSVREDQTQREMAEREMNADNVQDCSVEDLVNNMIESVDLSAMSNVLNISEQNIENNLQIVVYVDPDTATRSSDLDDSEAANDMRTFFANFIEINSDDDDDIRFEKLYKVKEEDRDDIIVLSDTEENVFYIDAKDEEVANTLYGDLPSQDEIPEATPDTSSPVADQAPTTTAPSSTFEVGQKYFLRFEEINHYSDGTLKVIKLQLENRLKAAVKIFLESRSELFQIENEEIQLFKKVLDTIDERLIFRSTLRRLEVLLGLNRLRQREERH